MAYLRRRAHLGVGELAAAAGISTRTLRRVEHDRAVPDLSTFVQIGAALGIPPAETACLWRAQAGDTTANSVPNAGSDYGTN